MGDVIKFPVKMHLAGETCEIGHCDNPQGLAHNCHQSPQATCRCCGECEAYCKRMAAETEHAKKCWARLQRFIDQVESND